MVRCDNTAETCKEEESSLSNRFEPASNAFSGRDLLKRPRRYLDALACEGPGCYQERHR